MAKQKQKKPNKQQRKDALVAARAELMLMLDGSKHTARAMTWNLKRTRDAMFYMKEFGELPWLWTLADFAKDDFIQTKMETRLKPLP